MQDLRVKLLQAPPYMRCGLKEAVLMIVVFGSVLFLGLVT